MIEHTPSWLSTPTFAKIAAEYRRRWNVGLCAADAEGAVVVGPSTGDDRECRRLRRHAIAESLRWGEPTVVEHPHRSLIWAAPVMHNARLLGGLIARTDERRVVGEDGGPRLDVRRACEDLRLLAERENLTNAALLAERRREYVREQKRAEAIQDLKTRLFRSVREVYLREEPNLIAALRSRQRGLARSILNRILVEIYYLGGDNLNLIKNFLMELVVTMSRTAAECGAEPEELLGSNYACVTELSAISGEEELSHWLVATLERIMDAIEARRRLPSAVLLHAAIRYMGDHFDEPIGRDDLARVAGLSPPHFARLFKRELGKDINDALNGLRIGRAEELLRSTDKSLLQIALEVGFKDPSYFTKIFRRHTQMLPRDYRKQHRAE